MDKKTFQIMYNALVDIASYEAFFDTEKEMVAIAKKALKDIVEFADSNNVSSTPKVKYRN